MAKIRIGVQLHPQQTTYDSFAGAVKQAEALGVDTIFHWDHFYPLYGDPGGNHFEAWTLLTAMAMLTSRVEVGCLVTSNSYRNPNLLADMARTVDHISHGRLILGIGAGWNERDYREYGYPYGTPATRLKDLGASLPVIQERLQKLVPPPTRPIPILIGGGGEKVTLRLVAQYADMWNTFGPPEQYRRKNDILNHWCREVGRDPAEIERTAHLGDAKIPDDLPAFLDAGSTHLIYGMGDPWDFGPVEKILAWREDLK